MALSLSDLPKLSASTEALRALPQSALRQVGALRHGLHVRREEGLETLFTRSADLVEKAHDVAENTAALSAVAPVLERSLDALTTPRVDDYDALNVKKVAEAVDSLDLLNLARVRRYETRNKDRVTVYRALDRAREARLAPPTEA